MEEDTRLKILRLINEKNDLYRDVTLDNILLSPPRPIDEEISFTQAGNHTYTFSAPGVFTVTLDGAGGGSGSSVDWRAPQRRNCSGPGLNGERTTYELTVEKNDTLEIELGAGGAGGAGDPSLFKGEPGEDGQRSRLYLNGQLVGTSLGGDGGAEGVTNQSAPLVDNPGEGSPGGNAVCSSNAYRPSTGERWGYGNPGNSGSDGRLYLNEIIEGRGDRNTGVTLTGVLNRGYRGQVEVYYKRHNLSTLFEGIDAPLFRDRNMGVDHILSRLNNRYGLFLQLDDLQPFDFGEFTDADLETTRPIELQVTDHSYGWTGTVTIELLYGNPLLESQILVQLLPILTHPDDLEELDDRRSGTVSTWAFDFTAWKDDLQINPRSGEWLNFARVQEIGRYAGLTFWYNGQVVDLPTAQVAGANPMFERVMVQTHAQGNVLGPLYFHYDANW